MFPGGSVGRRGVAFGEAVFTTGMTGYQETVTDPSYAEQLVCFTAPMVGNYGVADSRARVGRPHARAVAHARGSRRRSGRTGCRARDRRARRIDTRSLVLRLREAGRDARGRRRRRRAASSEALAASARSRRWTGAALVARRLDGGAVRRRRRGPGQRRSRRLRRASARSSAGSSPPARPSPSTRTTSTPTSSPATTASCSRTARATRSRSARRSRSCASRSAAYPVLGICLGHQLLGLATGHETYKLPFGHRGANHPVLERASGRVLVTSQNHGFAVAPSDGAEATHVSLYDGTVEGFDFPELRARSVQFHPEAGPGPARRLADPRALGRGGAPMPRRATSARSA